MYLYLDLKIDGLNIFSPMKEDKNKIVESHDKLSCFCDIKKG